jgi:hypothetical protein
MTPKVFGLAEIDEETGEPDPDRVRIWGMETESRAVMHWREDGKNQFAVFSSAERAEARFGPLFGLTLIWP